MCVLPRCGRHAAAPPLNANWCKKAVNAGKDFRYPKATESNCYNPQIFPTKIKFTFLRPFTHCKSRGEGGNKEIPQCLQSPEAHLYRSPKMWIKKLSLNKFDWVPSEVFISMPPKSALSKFTAQLTLPLLQRVLNIHYSWMLLIDPQDLR